MITFPRQGGCEAGRKRVRGEDAKSSKVRKKPASPRKLLLLTMLAGLLIGLLGVGEPVDWRIADAQPSTSGRRATIS
jgi:hypothetical protein